MDLNDQYYALTVLLEEPIKDEDAEALINAIRQLRGVMDVQPLIADPMAVWAKESARRDLIRQMMNILRK